MVLVNAAPQSVSRELLWNRKVGCLDQRNHLSVFHVLAEEVLLRLLVVYSQLLYLVGHALNNLIYRPPFSENLGLFEGWRAVNCLLYLLDSPPTILVVDMLAMRFFARASQIAAEKSEAVAALPNTGVRTISLAAFIGGYPDTYDTTPPLV